MGVKALTAEKRVKGMLQGVKEKFRGNVTRVRVTRGEKVLVAN